jgi:hypothetical protein
MRIIFQAGANVHSSPTASQAQAQLARVVEKKEHAALRVSELDGGVHQHGQNLFESGRAIQHLGHLEEQAKMLELGRATLLDLAHLFKELRQRHLVLNKSELIGVRNAQADVVAGFELAASNPLVVYKRSVAASSVFDKVAAFILKHFCVVPRDSTVEQYKVIVALPAHGKREPRNFNLALITRSIANQQAWQTSSHVELFLLGIQQVVYQTNPEAHNGGRLTSSSSAGSKSDCGFQNTFDQDAYPGFAKVVVPT